MKKLFIFSLFVINFSLLCFAKRRFQNFRRSGSGERNEDCETCCDCSTDVENPVCASNAKIYNNVCLFNCAKKYWEKNGSPIEQRDDDQCIVKRLLGPEYQSKVLANTTTTTADESQMESRAVETTILPLTTLLRQRKEEIVMVSPSAPATNETLNNKEGNITRRMGNPQGDAVIVTHDTKLTVDNNSRNQEDSEMLEPTFRFIATSDEDDESSNTPQRRAALPLLNPIAGAQLNPAQKYMQAMVEMRSLNYGDYDMAMPEKRVGQYHKLVPLKSVLRNYNKQQWSMAGQDDDDDGMPAQQTQSRMHQRYAIPHPKPRARQQPIPRSKPPTQTQSQPKPQPQPEPEPQPHSQKSQESAQPVQNTPPKIVQPVFRSEPTQLNNDEDSNPESEMTHGDNFPKKRINDDKDADVSEIRQVQRPSPAFQEETQPNETIPLKRILPQYEEDETRTQPRDKQARSQNYGQNGPQQRIQVQYKEDMTQSEVQEVQRSPVTIQKNRQNGPKIQAAGRQQGQANSQRNVPQKRIEGQYQDEIPQKRIQEQPRVQAGQPRKVDNYAQKEQQQNIGQKRVQEPRHTSGKQQKQSQTRNRTPQKIQLTYQQRKVDNIPKQRTNVQYQEDVGDTYNQESTYQRQMEDQTYPEQQRQDSDASKELDTEQVQEHVSQVLQRRVQNVMIDHIPERRQNPNFPNEENVPQTQLNGTPELITERRQNTQERRNHGQGHRRRHRSRRRNCVGKSTPALPEVFE